MSAGDCSCDHCVLYAQIESGIFNGKPSKAAERKIAPKTPDSDLPKRTPKLSEEDLRQKGISKRGPPELRSVPTLAEDPVVVRRYRPEPSTTQKKIHYRSSPNPVLKTNPTTAPISKPTPTLAKKTSDFKKPSFVRY